MQTVDHSSQTESRTKATRTEAQRKPESEAQRTGQSVRHRYYTVKRLDRMRHEELDKVFACGLQPRLEDLEGWEFQGWNATRLARLGGIRKFKKGFYREPLEPGPYELYGYNTPVRQNAFDAPHLALPNELTPRRFGYYLVTPGRPHGRDNQHPHALMLDYSRGPQNPVWDPSNALRDYLVQVDPNNPDLFLGKAYGALGPVRVFLSYFILQRYNKIGR